MISGWRDQNVADEIILRMFTINDRDRVRGHVLQVAASDARVVAGAVVGSLAHGDGDRWSDLDLTFGVVDDVPVREVLEDFTAALVDQLQAAHLFDLPSGPAIYRVFLLPGCLQLDLSFAPASNFGAVGTEFRLLFGQAVEKPHFSPPSAHQLFGYAVHHAVRARVCIERGRSLQAEYWISAVRNYALGLACRRRNLPAEYGRGFDDLPTAVRQLSLAAMVESMDRDELLRALGRVIELLLGEADDVRELATRVERQLRTLTAPWLESLD